ncbi:hypothetical protein BPA01_51250 [Brevibacillus parabrevis]|uniref:Uncharacterized protein n=1 Tax=Brevibacillus parabrevis TaxID=54914 RepID=A0A4Y3PRH6_BREPA|nr:hypothetical protein BPA01_51250 [Brevibacillus parabrevis]
MIVEFAPNGAMIVLWKEERDSVGATIDGVNGEPLMTRRVLTSKAAVVLIEYDKR